MHSQFCNRDGFHHAGQAGLELLLSNDLPSSASERAEITGVSHHAWPRPPVVMAYKQFFSFGMAETGI